MLISVTCIFVGLKKVLEKFQIVEKDVPGQQRYLSAGRLPMEHRGSKHLGDPEVCVPERSQSSSNHWQLNQDKLSFLNLHS